MYWQINGNKIVNAIKDIKTWFCTLASTFPCLPIEKQPTKKRLSTESLKFLAAFPIGVILAIKRTSFKSACKRGNNA
jgi:hypothetical protein